MTNQGWAHLDLRSLALFRIALGGVLLFDIASRFRDVTAFFTDEGVLPRLVLVESNYSDYWLDFHLGVGTTSGLVVLLCLQLFLAGGVLIGWQTRWTTLGSWVMLNSLHARNPFVHDRGDLELALLLFWGVFLPLGARWSVDARRSEPIPGSERGLPAAAYIVQIALVYLFAAYLKYGDFWLVRGDGMYHSLLSPLFATGLAGWLSTWPPTLLKVVNYGTIAGEYFVGFLLLCPKSVNLLRSSAIVLIASFHLGVLILFKLGLFPIIALVSLLALVPQSWWKMPPLSALEEVLDKRVGGEGVPTGVGLLGKLFVGSCLALAILSNVAKRPDTDAFSRPKMVRRLSQLVRVEQNWDLFSPQPPYNGVFELQKVDDPGVLITIPESRDFRNHRWRMLMISSLYPSFYQVRPGLVRELLKDQEPGEYEYRFRVRLTEPDGKVGEAEVWSLWRGVVEE